jgi:hypothetical protein
MGQEAWAEEQPRDGDVILQCGHIREGGREHWFHVSPPLPFKRPDRTEAIAKWILACPACAVAAGFDPLKVTIRADATWMGNEPFIPRRKN